MCVYVVILFSCVVCTYSYYCMYVLYWQGRTAVADCQINNQSINQSCTKREFENETFEVHTSSRKSMKKFAMKVRKQGKTTQCKMFLSQFISHIQRSSEEDLNELQINNSGDNECTILVNKWMGFFSSVGTQTGAIKLAILVFRISGADFLHCWVTDSM